MSDDASILLTIGGTAVGAVASWYFYRKSGVDLDAALRRLDGNHQKQLQAANALARMLEQSGIGKASYDAEGNLTGIAIAGAAHTVGRVSHRADATVVRGVPPQYDRQHEQPPTPEPEGEHA